MDKLNSITDKDYRMMIVGYAANKGYSKNTESFEYLISQSSFSEKTILIPEVSHDKIGDYYNQADAFIMTSIQEGQPVSAMEAACCGLPIFSTRCGGVEDYVDEDIGRIYNVTDVEGMARGLKDFLEENIVFDPEMIRNKVISKFGKKEFIKKFSEAFYGVMNEGN